MRDFESCKHFLTNLRVTWSDMLRRSHFCIANRRRLKLETRHMLMKFTVGQWRYA